MRILVLISLAVLIPSVASFGHEGFPKTFTDGKGHTVTLNDPPQRIASLTLGTDENLLDLVSAERLVAMTAISREPYVSNVADRVPQGPVMITKEWEKIAELKPDLVIVAVYTPELADPLIAAGLPVYQFTEFHGIESLLKNFETLGQLTGETAAAEKVLVDCRKRLSAAAEWRPEKPIRALYYSEGRIFAAGTTPSEVLEMAGAANAASEFGLSGTVAATPKLLANLNPDVIFVGEDSKEAEEGTMKLFASPEYAGVPAVKAGKIHAIPGKHVTTVSWHIVEAVEDAQRFLSSK